MSEARLSGSWMDVSDEKASGSIDPSADPSNGDSDVSASSGLKSCTDCRTTKTPLWRGGPSGPKSLCNACGIRYRKKRRPVMGMKERDMVGERPRGSAKDKREEKRDSMNKRMKSLEMTMMGFRGEIFWKLSSLIRKKNRRRLGEEEEAAILLMAISSGFVYA